jgi:TonB family protein
MRRGRFLLIPQPSTPPARIRPTMTRSGKRILVANPCFHPKGKTSAGTPVKLASKVDVVARKKTPADRSNRSKGDRSLLLADVAADVAVPHEVPSSQNGSQIGSQTESRSDETASAEPPAIPASSTTQPAADGVPSAKASLPGLFVPVSRGVSGGQLVHRVAPVYPAQARLLRLEGTVVLSAMVMEDGTVRDVKVVEGLPELAQAAVDAVKRWRYKPFESRRKTGEERDRDQR